MSNVFKLVIVCLTAIGIPALVGCSSIGFVPQSADTPRAFNSLADDAGGLIVAFDVPQGLQPVPNASVLRFAFNGAGETRQIEARLILADPGDAASALPAPAQGRTYFLLGLSPADQASLRNAQAWARSQPSTLQATMPTLMAQFCATGGIDPARTTVSVVLAMPGKPAPELLLKNQTLVALLVQAGQSALPICS